ncbi:MAG: Stp1/IreP family PP2C-type Ser/Thr phosphatase [Eubacteriales bacterium]|nr:Stp1/IreP family PP2C-type Ser/Thr phosphatase [Eubacteriales bacterium]
MNAIIRTHIGNVMQNNQDSYLALAGSYPIYAVADGMGGHRGGNIASKMAVEIIARELSGLTPNEDELKNAIDIVNAEIYTRQLNDANLSGMGTTLTVLWEHDGGFLLGHVGDSRCYLIREGKLYQMSRDHSLVAELVNSGVLPPEKAASYPYRNVITRAVGTDKKVNTDISLLEKSKGDIWLLCSDGLTEYVRAEELLSIVSENSLEDAADKLIKLALDRGGRDNITLLILGTP